MLSAVFLNTIVVGKGVKKEDSTVICFQAEKSLLMQLDIFPGINSIEQNKCFKEICEIA